MTEESDIDVTNQEDHFDDGDDIWSEDDEDLPEKTINRSNTTYHEDGYKEGDEENCPPKNIIKKHSFRLSNLNTIPEESRSHFSSFQSNKLNKNSDSIRNTGKPVKSYTPKMDTVLETRKASISFGEKSFGSPDYFDTVIKQSDAEERRQQSYLRSRQDAARHSKIESKNPLSSFSYHSSKPHDSNTTTRSIPHNSSKPLTSTPKSERSGSRFTVDVSEICDKSKTSSPSYTNTSINGLIKNIDLNESSTVIAKNFQSNLRAPKNAKLIDEIRMKREKSEISVRQNLSTSNINKPKTRKPDFLPVPALPRIFEHRPLSNRPSTSASNSVEIAIKPEPLTHFGFVAVGEEVQSKVHVRNHSSHILEVTPKLRCTSFKLASPGTVQIHPNSSHEFGIIFAPTECSKYRHALRFYVASSGNTYSHTLLGYGGTSDVKVIEKRGLSYYPLSGVYRCLPSSISTFEYEIENFGDRTAFVQIVALNGNGSEAPSITVKPKSFCLAGKCNNVDDTSKTKITVSIPESYLQELRRMSVESVTSASSAKRNNIFTLQVYFGDERLRQRAKKYSDEIKVHEIFQGLSLTKTSFPNLHGEEATSVDCDRISIQDMEMLKSQTRVLTIFVGDDRTAKFGTHSMPFRPPSSFSHRGLLDNGYYIPECNVEGDSTFLTVADNDRTMRR